MPDVVGLAMHGQTIRGVEARLSRNGRCTVVRTGSIAIPETTIEDGKLNDPDVLAESIRQLWIDAGFKTKRVRIGIDGRTAVVRRTELPSPNETKLRQAASYDIAELLNYPISEAVFDVDEIERFERDGHTWAQALVVAVRASALVELGSIAKQAGLRLAGTDLVAEALARAIDLDTTSSRRDQEADTDPNGDEHGPVAIVDCEDSLTNVVIRDHTGVLFARTLNAGVGETAISVAEELESALAQLSGDGTTTGAAPSDAAAGVSTVVEGVRRTLSYYATELDRRPIQNVTVVGGRGEASGLLSALESTLAVPTAHAVPSVDWSTTDPFLGFELALGVALGSTRSLRTRHLVLTSDQDRALRARRNQRVAGIAMAVPLAIVLATSSSGLRDRTADLQSGAQQAEANADALALRLTDFEDTRFRVDEWVADASDIQMLDEQRLRLGVVVAELAEAMPVDSRLVSVQLRRTDDEGALTGYIGPEPFGLVSITGIADDLDGVGRWIEQVNATSTIEGLWLDQSSFGPLGTDAQLGAIFTIEGAITGAARAIDPLVESIDLSNDGSDSELTEVGE